MLGGRHLFSQSAQIEIPEATRILAWSGAKKQEIRPLLKAIRMNAENALRALPAEQQKYHCIVTTDGNWVRIEVANAFNRAAGTHPLSSGIGLRNIKRRVQLLGGRIVRPFPTIRLDTDPPTWRVAFELPAAQEGDATDANNE